MKPQTVVAALLGVAGLCAIAFALVYLFGANVQYAALTTGTMFMAFAAALVVWEHQLMAHEQTVEARDPMPSADPVETTAESALAEGGETIARRPWLVRMLGGVAALIGVAFVLPLRSLVPAGSAPLDRTTWRRGVRLVRDDGTIVRAGDLALDSVITVFPDGHVRPEDSSDMATTATLLIRVPPEQLELPAERRAWAPQGLVAYSKVCTHAGCPVALYRSHERQLFCPCHQSTFDVLRGGAVLFGPADRALPQLPIRVEADGTLVADGDYPEPVGPASWDHA